VAHPGLKRISAPAIRYGGADDAGLELVVANLTSDIGWADATAGIEEIHHVASSIALAQPEDPEDMIRPARDGTLRVLRAARDAGAHRVVLSSSFAAVGYSPKPSATYTEEDWTDPDRPGLPPYPRSKTIAERAAWDFAAAEGGQLELVSVNPTFILGPTLTRQLGSSMKMLKAMLEGKLPPLRRQSFGVVDVRDVADLHVRAMAAPEAAGRRYLAVGAGTTITFGELAQTLRERLGDFGERVSAVEAPGDAPRQITIRNERARNELGWRPRPMDATIVDSAESLRELGLIEAAGAA
jgi:nucleoside-diphosphate-sugar epimerase